MDIVDKVLFVVALLVEGGLFCFYAGRLVLQNRRLADNLQALVRIEQLRQEAEQQRYLYSVRVQRAELMRQVAIAPGEALLTIERIVRVALGRPLTLTTLLQARAEPVPALVFSTEKEEIVLTTSGDAYVEQVLWPARRLAKGERAAVTSILPGPDQLVVDEELYQSFAYLAEASHVDVGEIPHVEVWQVLCLPEISIAQMEK